MKNLIKSLIIVVVFFMVIVILGVLLFIYVWYMLIIAFILLFLGAIATIYFYIFRKNKIKKPKKKDYVDVDFKVK